MRKITFLLIFLLLFNSFSTAADFFYWSHIGRNPFDGSDKVAITYSGWSGEIIQTIQKKVKGGEYTMGEILKTKNGITEIVVGSKVFKISVIDSMVSGGYEFLQNVVCSWENVESVPAKVFQAEDNNFLYLAMKCSWHCTNWLFVRIKKEVKSPTPPPTPPCTTPIPTPPLTPQPPVETPPPSLSTPPPTPSFPGKSTKVDTSSAYAEGYTNTGSIFTGVTITIGHFSDPEQPSPTCSPSPFPSGTCDPAGTPVATPPIPDPTHPVVTPVPGAPTPPPLPTLVPVVTPVPQGSTPPPSVPTNPPVSGGTPAPTPPLPGKK